MQVREAMSTANVVTVVPKESALRALNLCEGHRIRHLPVLAHAEGRLVGIVSDRDLKDAGPPLGATQEKKEAILNDIEIGQLMTRDVLTAHPSDSVEAVARLLVDNKIGCLPIVEDGALVGIVTTSDLLRAAVRLWEAVATVRTFFLPSGE